MDIRQLEKVVRSASERSATQSTLETLSSNGQSLVEMPDEFVKAVETLAGRATNVVQNSLLKEISSKWM